jgi:hypothetical protein
MHLCLNCLAVGARPFAVGPDKGGQRDAYRDTIDLCGECSGALATADLSTFTIRHAENRTVRRAE